MPLIELVRLALTGLRASPFSFMSNVLATTVGLTFLGTLLALMTGVGHSLERYYTRTVSLTTLTVYQPEDHVGVEPFDQEYRQKLIDSNDVRQVIYHELGFAQIGITQGKMKTVCLRSAIKSDPEIERLERLAGSNLADATDPLHPTVVIPLIVAQRLSDLTPAELIGTEVAIVADRSLTLEDETQEGTLYGKIVGVVNESPENCVYIDYKTLAVVSSWKRERKNKTTESESPSGKTEPASPINEPALSEPHPSAVEDQPPECGDDTKAITAGDTPNPTKVAVERAPESAFAYATLHESWNALKESLTNDSIVYPNLRLHFGDLEAVTKYRKSFREAGLPTDSVLDDVATIRDLRYYGWMIGSIIGLIALIAAACSIFNTLLASVERRTAEVGILRVLGASTREILTLFLLEGLLVAAVGAAISSLLLATGATFANRWLLERLASNPEYEHLAALSPELLFCDARLVGVVMLTGAIVALTSSFVPALLACRIQPASALRHR